MPCLFRAGWPGDALGLCSADADVASPPNLPGASHRTWRRAPTAWRMGQTSPHTGGESGPSGRRVPGPAGEV